MANKKKNVEDKTVELLKLQINELLELILIKWNLNSKNAVDLLGAVAGTMYRNGSPTLRHYIKEIALPGMGIILERLERDFPLSSSGVKKNEEK